MKPTWCKTVGVTSGRAIRQKGNLPYLPLRSLLLMRYRFDGGEIVGRDIIVHSIDRLGKADTNDVQQIAASQIELLNAYHQVALAQSSRSFFWALIGSGVGLASHALAQVICTFKQGRIADRGPDARQITTGALSSYVILSTHGVKPPPEPPSEDEGGSGS
jgi:hypothetical protein